MKTLRLPVVLLLSCCAGCGRPDARTQEPALPNRYHVRASPTDTAPAITDPPPPTPATRKAYPDNQQHGNEIRIAFARGKDAITVRGRMGKPGHPVICYLEMNANQKLTAGVQGATGPANIRFTRIILPDGTSDGPFGATLTHDTRQTGVYQLEIGANLMADNAYEGDFTLEVWVK